MRPAITSRRGLNHEELLVESGEPGGLRRRMLYVERDAGEGPVRRERSLVATACPRPGDVEGEVGVRNGTVEFLCGVLVQFVRRLCGLH